MNEERGVVANKVSNVSNGVPIVGVNFSINLDELESANITLPYITVKNINAVDVLVKFLFKSLIVIMKHKAWNDPQIKKLRVTPCQRAEPMYTANKAIGVEK